MENKETEKYIKLKEATERLKAFFDKTGSRTSTDKCSGCSRRK